MIENLKIYEAVRAVPEEAQKEIKGGRLSGMTDINPMWRIQVLTEQFGVCGIGWYYTVSNKWIEQAGDELLCFVDIDLFIKVDGEWSKPIHGTGGSKILGAEKSGLRADDDGFKKATTDAISVACKSLGIGADIYWKEGVTKYSSSEEDRSDVMMGYPAKDIMLKEIARKYPKGSDAEKTLLVWAKASSMDEMSLEQLMAVYNKVKA